MRFIFIVDRNKIDSPDQWRAVIEINGSTSILPWENSEEMAAMMGFCFVGRKLNSRYHTHIPFLTNEELRIKEGPAMIV